MATRDSLRWDHRTKDIGQSGMRMRPAVTKYGDDSEHAPAVEMLFSEAKSKVTTISAVELAQIVVAAQTGLDAIQEVIARAHIHADAGERVYLGDVYHNSYLKQRKLDKAAREAAAEGRPSQGESAAAKARREAAESAFGAAALQAAKDRIAAADAEAEKLAEAEASQAASTAPKSMDEMTAEELQAEIDRRNEAEAAKAKAKRSTAKRRTAAKAAK